jgi:hypothetical protein
MNWTSINLADSPTVAELSRCELSTVRRVIAETDRKIKELGPVAAIGTTAPSATSPEG